MWKLTIGEVVAYPDKGDVTHMRWKESPPALAPKQLDIYIRISIHPVYFVVYNCLMFNNPKKPMRKLNAKETSAITGGGCMKWISGF